MSVLCVLCFALGWVGRVFSSLDSLPSPMNLLAGSLVVQDTHGEFIGIVTERDFMKGTIRGQKTVEDIMTFKDAMVFAAPVRDK